jgi:diguanylate cyclase (GGDEF)-like protein/PAS domain S-box-containing protein
MAEQQASDRQNLPASLRGGLVWTLPAVSAILLALIGGGHFAQKEHLRLQERRLQTVEKAAAHARLIEHRVEQATSAASMLGAVLEATHSFSTMDVVIERMLNARPDISSVQISPGGVVWRHYTNGRLGALPASSTQEAPPASAGLAPYGTVALSADPASIQAAQTIYSVGNNSSRYWGQVAAQLNVDDLRSNAGLGRLEAEGYFHRLVFQPVNDGDPIVLSQTGPASGLAIEHALLLAGGESLVLQLHPKEGLSPNSFLFVELALVAVAAVLLGVFLYIVARQLDLFKRQRTSKLAADAGTPDSLEPNGRLLDLIFDHLPLLLTLRRSDDLTIVRVNAFAERFFGREQAELRGQKYADFLPAERARQLTEADLKALRDGDAVDLPALQIQAADTLRTLIIRKVPLPGRLGLPGYVLDVGEDVTERQMLMASINGQLHFLEHLIDTIPLPILVQDRDGHVVQVNQACERFFGQTRAKLVSGTETSLSALLSPKVPTRLLETRGTRIQLDDQRTADILLQRAIFETATENGNDGGIVNVIIDLTERQQAQRQIEQINRTLAVVTSVNETIVRVRERLPILERACEILVEQGGFPLTWFEFDDVPEEQPAIAKGTGQEHIFAIRALVTACDQPCTHHAIDTGRVRVCLAANCHNEELPGLLARNSFGSMIRLSIPTSPGRTGSLAILTAASQTLTSSEEKLFGDLANDLSYAMEAIGQEEMRRHADGKLKLAAQVFENAAEGIMITDARNRILMVNKAFSKVTGYSPDEVMGQNPRLLNSGKHDAAFYLEMWETIQKRGEWHGEVQNRRKNGKPYTEWLTISAVRSEEGEITNYVAVFTDLTSAKQIEEKLDFLVNYDPLTSLPNRVLFNDRLEQAIAKARTDGTHVAVFFLDLDRFSLINETFGHSAGDRVLKEVSTRLKATLRSSDSASRLGGDEFAMILPALASIEEASHVASKVMHALALPFSIDDQELYTSASVGISVFPEDGEEVETLVKNADSAMYRAMHEGRNTFRFYHQEMNARSSERIAMESDLRRALDRGELALHYQPFIDTCSGRIVGAEALLRWNRPGFGTVAPGDFIPLLEETGLIVPVGEWILQTACTANQLWRQRGFADLFVAVNFSAVQLRGDGVARRLADMLTRLDFDPRHLEIELTESMVMHDAEQGIRTLNEFKEIGTQLSIDDFGTGYSSLAYLKRLPLDTLKIDRSFITDTPHESEANAIVQAIVAMGHSLNLKIIAEGVEEAEQVDFLRKMRCDLLQGFYFSRPVEQERFIELLQQQPRP